MSERRKSTRHRRKSAKLVRPRESLVARIQAAPLDLWLSASETIETIHWDELTHTLAVPGAVAGHVALALCRVVVTRVERPIWGRGMEEDDIFGSGSTNGGSGGSEGGLPGLLYGFVSFAGVAAVLELDL